MGLRGRIYTVTAAAKLIGEDPELIEEVISNSDNVDYGTITRIEDGTEDGLSALRERGVQSVQEFIADVRTWVGGVEQFLIDQACDPEVVRRIMAAEMKR
jgi:hypothetical protein